VHLSDGTGFILLLQPAESPSVINVLTYCFSTARDREEIVILEATLVRCWECIEPQIAQRDRSFDLLWWCLGTLIGCVCLSICLILCCSRLFDSHWQNLDDWSAKKNDDRYANAEEDVEAQPVVKGKPVSAYEHSASAVQTNTYQRRNEFWIAKPEQNKEVRYCKVFTDEEMKRDRR
jgi:hypothetical protein